VAASNHLPRLCSAAISVKTRRIHRRNQQIGS
jgi:hypothetical protein